MLIEIDWAFLSLVLPQVCGGEGLTKGISSSHSVSDEDVVYLLSVTESVVTNSQSTGSSEHGRVPHLVVKGKLVDSLSCSSSKGI